MRKPPLLAQCCYKWGIGLLFGHPRQTLLQKQRAMNDRHPTKKRNGSNEAVACSYLLEILSIVFTNGGSVSFLWSFFAFWSAKPYDEPKARVPDADTNR
jgi:hypothetical protein